MRCRWVGSAWLLGLGLAMAQEPSPDRTFLEGALHPARRDFQERTPFLAAALLPGGRQVVLVAGDRIVVRRVSDGWPITGKGLSFPLRCRPAAVISPGLDRLAVFHGERVSLWRLLPRGPWLEAAGTQPAPAGVEGTAFTADGRWLVAACEGATATVWPLGPLGEPSPPLSAAGYAEVAGGPPDVDTARCRAWALSPDTPSPLVPPPAGGASAAVFAPDGSLERVGDRAALGQLLGLAGPPRAVGASPDGRWIVATDEASAVVAACRSASIVRVGELPLERTTSWRRLQVTRDGLLVASEGRVRVWPGPGPWRASDPVQALPRCPLTRSKPVRPPPAAPDPHVLVARGGAAVVRDAHSGSLRLVEGGRETPLFQDDPPRSPDSLLTWTSAALTSDWILATWSGARSGGLQAWRRRQPLRVCLGVPASDASWIELAPGERWAVTGGAAAVRAYSLSSSRPILVASRAAAALPLGWHGGDLWLVEGDRPDQIRVVRLHLATGADGQQELVERGSWPFSGRLVSRFEPSEWGTPRRPRRAAFRGGTLLLEGDPGTPLCQERVLHVRDLDRGLVAATPLPFTGARLHPEGGLMTAGSTLWRLGPDAAQVAEVRADSLWSDDGERLDSWHDHWSLPLRPNPVQLGPDLIDWRWTAVAPEERPRVRAHLSAPAEGELALTVEHAGGDTAFLLRGLLWTVPDAEPVWVALGTLAPGQPIVRRLRGPAPVEGARLELADQWGILGSQPCELR